MSAKNIEHAKGGTLFAAAIKFLSLPMFVLPGMISRILFTGKFIFLSRRMLKIVSDILTTHFTFYAVGGKLLVNHKLVLFSPVR